MANNLLKKKTSEAHKKADKVEFRKPNQAYYNMNQISNPNAMADHGMDFSTNSEDDSQESPLQEKRRARDVKEKELSGMLVSGSDVLKTLKGQVVERETEISDLQAKYKSQSAEIVELEEKLSKQNKANAETNLRYFE